MSCKIISPPKTILIWYQLPELYQEFLRQYQLLLMPKKWIFRFLHYFQYLLCNHIMFFQCPIYIIQLFNDIIHNLNIAYYHKMGNVFFLPRFPQNSPCKNKYPYHIKAGYRKALSGARRLWHWSTHALAWLGRRSTPCDPGKGFAVSGFYLTRDFFQF